MGRILTHLSHRSLNQPEVYLAHDVATHAPVALKVLRQDHRGPLDIERLRREYTLAARFRHPHIVEVIAHRAHWLAMTYLDGGNATSLNTVTDQLAALTQIADALDLVHRDGIVHCDVKPANILVSKDFSSGGAVLIDFGVAHSRAEDVALRLSQDGTQRFSLDPARRISHSVSTRQPAPIRCHCPTPLRKSCWAGCRPGHLTSIRWHAPHLK